MFGKKYQKTNFAAGGLLEDMVPRSDREVMEVPSEFISPRKIDSRDMCLSSSDQNKTPHCAGYATAGYIEYRNWKTKHFPKQINGNKIYYSAKQIDQNNRMGTSLHSAAKAAINMGLIKGIPKYTNYSDVEDSDLPIQDVMIISTKFALHEYGVLIAGFNITDEWLWVDKKTGIIRNLGMKAKQKGGHAVLICGYDSIGVYIQNSWGSDWGHYGFATLSWEQYLKQFSGAIIIEP